MLVVFGGLPGVGKSLLSREIAARLDATWLRIDAIEAVMWRLNIAEEQSGIGAYAVAHTVASAQLSLGRPVIVDAVNPVEEARQGWRGLATDHDVELRYIEVICSNTAEHRRRVENRVASVDQPRLPTWHGVVSRQYEPWTSARLTVDSLEPKEECLARIMAYLR